MTITETNAKRDQLTHDVFVTAFEGGINYWASVSEYRWSTGDGSTNDLEGFRGVLHETEEDDKEHVVDRAVIEKGIRLAANTEELYALPEHARPSRSTQLLAHAWVSGSDEAIDDVDFDGCDGDNVVQLGLFGKVVYG